jgi:Holliday junction resolvase
MIYETIAHRGDEQAAMSTISNKFSCNIYSTPTTSLVDFVMCRGNSIVAVGEYKRRSTKYPTLTIDTSKIQALLSAAELLGATPVLFIQWPDGLHYHTVTNTSYQTSYQSLRDPRDNKDINDLVFHIPLSEFRPIGP